MTEGQEVKTEQATYMAAVDQQEASLAKAKATEANAALQLGCGKDLVRSQNIPQVTVDQGAASAGGGHGFGGPPRGRVRSASRFGLRFPESRW